MVNNNWHVFNVFSINIYTSVRIIIRVLVSFAGYLICVLQVQKVLSQSAVFSGLTPGSLYRFEVRTEKQSFTDSSPVTINITAGKYRHTSTSTSPSLFPNNYHFLLCQLPAQWRSLLSIKPHHPYALVGVC